MKIPNSKPQIPIKSQTLNPKNLIGKVAGNLEFEVWDFIGVWDLGIGASRNV